MRSLVHKIPAGQPALQSTNDGACVFCGNASTPQFSTRDQAGEDCSFRRCTACRTQFIFPPPDSERLTRAYATTYYGDGESKFGPTLEKARGFFANSRARQMTRGLQTHSRVLDVGCGDGRLLRTISKQGDFDLYGVELPGKAAERAAKVPKINLHLGSLETARFPDEHFDLITLVHVIEHLPKPHETIQELARIIRPGGSLFLSFPNIESWQSSIFKGLWFHLDPPRHLSLIPPAAITNSLQGAQFQRVFSKHLNLEQNIYGWVQSMLNLSPARRNLLYERIKNNSDYTSSTSNATIAAHVAAAALILPTAILADIVAAIFSRGATVEMLFRKNNR